MLLTLVQLSGSHFEIRSLFFICFKNHSYYPQKIIAREKSFWYINNNDQALGVS